MWSNPKLQRIAAVLAGSLLGATLVVAPATASTSTPAPVALTPPAIPGVTPLPGTVAPAASASATMGLLSVSPSEAVAGTPITISGTGLGAHASVALTWSTANVTWMVDPEPDTVNYMGRSATNFFVVLTTATTDASGAFSVTLKAPEDWGGIHDLYAVINNVEVAHGGFILDRTLTVTPKSGPVGTPITITYSGLGSSLYPGGAALLYDNHFTGEMMANWTRGTARVVIRAAGPVGTHVIQVGDAIEFLYMNIQQSPLPFAKGGSVKFTVTKDNGRPAKAIDWPVSVAPTVSARTTLQSTGLSTSSGVTAALSKTTGPVNAKISLTASGLSSSAPVQVVWSTVVGSRVNCTSTCWAFVSSQLATGTPSGNSLSTSFSVPDGLGGWHVVQLVQGGQVVAQVPFYVHVSIVGKGVSSLVVHEGQHFTVHLKGVGWTQLDNTFAVDYDNSYVGYACGFNSNGDVVANLVATGSPGTHLIDFYPMLYTSQPSFAGTPYGLAPVLSYAKDEPALALGYHLPAIRLAVTVVK